MAVAPGAQGVYWVGQDGNIWYKTGDNTRNMGKALNADDNYFQSVGGNINATRIDDPNPQPQPQQQQFVLDANTPAPSAPNGGSVGAAGPVAPPKPDKSNSIALNNAGLSKVDQSLNTGIGKINEALGKVTGQYDTEYNSNKTIYGDNSTTNQQNLQRNKQSALVNAAQGRQGLFGVMSSLGALSGSGIDLANNAVKKGANDDLSGAADNFSTNQVSLDNSFGAFEAEDKRRRENAKIAAKNAETNARGDAAKQKQEFYTNLSNDYAAMGDSGNSMKFADLAGGLYGDIAKSNIPNSQIAYTGAAFTPATLESYMTGAENMQVKATPAQAGQGTGGLIASPLKRRERERV